MSLLGYNVVDRSPTCPSGTRFQFSPWLNRIQNIFTLQDSCPLSSSLTDKEILSYYGIENVKFVEIGAYSKAPIYHGIWGKTEVAIKAVKISDNKPTKHARAELVAVKQLHHPYIVQHFAYFRATNRIFSVMEWMSDGTLGRYLRTHSYLDHETIKTVFKQILSAVGYLHSSCIAHRDIKDENISIKIDHRGKPIPKLIDFGFAVKMRSHKEKCFNFCGTRSYKSPELLHAEAPYNPFKADVWAMGVLLYKMICRKYPEYSIEKRRVTIDNPALHDWSFDVIKFILVINPENRPSINQVDHSKWFRSICI